MKQFHSVKYDLNKFWAPRSDFSDTAWPSEDIKWSTGMKNLICQESKKNREILSHITLRQYFTQSLCHLKFRSYTSFKTNVVACHITTEHSSKSPNWQQSCFQNLFLLPMVAAWSAEIKSCNLLLLIFCWFQLIKLKKKKTELHRILCITH